MNKFRKYGISILLIFCTVQISVCQKLNNSSHPVVTILSTDLSVNTDPDDWFDLYLFLKLDKLNPAGIILDYYATDTVADMTKDLLALMGQENIPIKRGIAHEIKLYIYVKRYIPTLHEGANFILETMKKAKGKVRLIAVGTLRNEALAFLMDSSLFLKKIDKLYFVGGNKKNLKGVNVERGLKAAEIIFNSSIPKVWIPCTQNLKLQLPGYREKQIYKRTDSISLFLSKRLKDWRNFKPNKFFKRTEQYPFGKNLWSFAAFFHAAGSIPSKMKFERGDASLNLKEEKINFVNKKSGKDLLLIKRDEGALVNLFWKLLTN